MMMQVCDARIADRAILDKCIYWLITCLIVAGYRPASKTAGFSSCLLESAKFSCGLGVRARKEQN